MMIGVAARADQHDVVREFFELFKTPWELCREREHYAVLLDAGDSSSDQRADLVLLYGSQPTAIDHQQERLPGPPRRNASLSWGGERIPLYGNVASFAPDGDPAELVLAETGEAVVSVRRWKDRVVVRIGYDLFEEVRFLLTVGQPVAHAGIPALERHIALLRSWIVRCGIPLVEIPPVPEGHRFMVCLTHDLDHPSIRLHGFDHTTFGFLYRALLSSLFNAARGRISLGSLRRNVVAALSLPFVHLGWAEDFWLAFDRYLEIEKGLGSTFFVIALKGDPGRTPDGSAPRKRASAYGASDIADRVRALVAAGSEVGLHGIDAWFDSRRGCDERETISRVAGARTAGSRMHWLFFDGEAPTRLEEAGLAYDSTVGYNETVGFRAGTLQAFKPIAATRLLEMPMAIMDTALFYPAYLNLTHEGARGAVRPLVVEAERYGGALTINWHDRSLAPDRLWGEFYSRFLDELKARTPWFPTLEQAASWFRQRRSATFDSVRREGDFVHVTASADCRDDLPGLRVRVHTPHPVNGEDPLMTRRGERFTDLSLKTTLDAHVRVQARPAQEGRPR